ncbi:MAG: PA2169 family four-helix-bundle protein [Acidimicrobiia bacterium]|nr:PA2169 family four-helix-bundle protein [Acidimicrobiia bacterium]MBT8215165.1 PA2169 family four-helix-bundle protein [Acidimicrobiia bacterium]NNF68500.1 PA2169 family four-helix-bundle protein [Acidimicrobiia bacterium]
MKTRDPSTIALRDLITICEDAAAGLRAAAGRVHNADIREALARQAHCRVSCAEELRLLVEARGDTSPPGGTAVGTAHRGWMDVRAAFEADDPAIVVECLRGEQSALERFEGALAYVDEEAGAVILRALDGMRAFRESLLAMEAVALHAHRQEVRREELVEAHARDLHEEHRPG